MITHKDIAVEAAITEAVRSSTIAEARLAIERWYISQQPTNVTLEYLDNRVLSAFVKKGAK